MGPVDQTWTIEDIIAENDRVAVRATNTCLQESFLGIPSGGRWQAFTATFMLRIADGMILETWRNADDLGRLLQLGVRIEPQVSDQRPTGLCAISAHSHRRDAQGTESTSVEEIRRASEQYYAALSHLLEGDAGPLMEAWSHSPDATAMNPYGGREVGWERLREVFEQVARFCAGGQVSLHLEDELIRVGGELAYQMGIECGEGTIAGQPASIRHRVTNIYRREGGAWKMLHRHADLNPSEQQDLSRLLQSPAEQVV
jgi:ketosteroid isomerase-like protein